LPAELNLTNEKLMTVGEVAAKADVSVRTVQYYDKCGLLKPSAYSEGGNRLYSSQDLVMLHQIKSLKHLGLSLGEIKSQLISLDVPQKVLELLLKQKIKIASNIESMKETLSAINLLESEIENNNHVDFAKYAAIISDAHRKWDSFWILDAMEYDLRRHVIEKFENESASDFHDYIMGLLDAIIGAKESSIPAESREGQELASKFWEMIEDFTDGKADLLESMFSIPGKMEGAKDEFSKKWRQVESFISEALGAYFENNPDKAPKNRGG